LISPTIEQPQWPQVTSPPELEFDRYLQELEATEDRRGDAEGHEDPPTTDEQ
jgi:hypothetical protein